MAERLTRFVKAGADALELRDLKRRAGYSGETSHPVEKELRGHINMTREAIFAQAYVAASTEHGMTAGAFPEDAFQLPATVIEEAHDPRFGNVQIATVLRYHPAVVEERTGFGHLSEGYDVTLPPSRRFKDVSYYIVPEDEAVTTGFSLIHPTTLGLHVARHTMEQPTLRGGIHVEQLFAERERLQDVRDLVEGTAVRLTGGEQVLLRRNFDPQVN